MEENVLINIAKMIETAIQEYEELLSLYKEKKQALLTPDRRMLEFVDDKIVAQVQCLTKLNKEREQYCLDNGIESVRITELIDLSSKEKPGLTEVYEEQKVKIRKLADEITLINQTNVELLKHNLIMSDKLLDIIISAATPQKDNYDMHGRNVDTSEISISSIVEDA